MLILALAPIVAGFALALAAVAVLLAEVVGKGALGAAETAWTAIKPGNHVRPVRQGG